MTIARLASTASANGVVALRFTASSLKPVMQVPAILLMTSVPEALVRWQDRETSHLRAKACVHCIVAIAFRRTFAYGRAAHQEGGSSVAFDASKIPPELFGSWKQY